MGKVINFFGLKNNMEILSFSLWLILSYDVSQKLANMYAFSDKCFYARLGSFAARAIVI